MVIALPFDEYDSKGSALQIEHLTARVVARSEVAADVLRLDLAPEGEGFPAWTPGAHVDVVLPDGDARQYSLMGSPASTTAWSLGVLVERNGRGGSQWIADTAVEGATLTLSAPRNHFPYTPRSVRTVFIAGGIGITALMPMIAWAEAEGRDWELHYVGRSASHMAFTDALRGYGDRVHLYPRDSSARPPLAAILASGAPVDVYCCGPESLIEEVETLSRERANVSAYFERFAPRPIAADAPHGFESFDVTFDYSGLEAHVGPAESILAAAERVGIEVPTSCREGTCGTCETPILSGEVVHLDSVLSDAEREASATMMICISRANCPRLVLDL